MKYKNIAQKVIIFILLTCRLFFLISNFFKHNYLSQYAIKKKLTMFSFLDIKIRNMRKM